MSVYVIFANVKKESRKMIQDRRKNPDLLQMLIDLPYGANRYSSLKISSKSVH